MTHGLRFHHAWSVGDGEVTVNQVFNTQKRPRGLSGTQTARLARGRPKHNFPSSGRFFSIVGTSVEMISVIVAVIVCNCDWCVADR